MAINLAPRNKNYQRDNSGGGRKTWFIETKEGRELVDVIQSKIEQIAEKAGENVGLIYNLFFNREAYNNGETGDALFLIDVDYADDYENINPHEEPYISYITSLGGNIDEDEDDFDLGEIETFHSRESAEIFCLTEFDGVDYEEAAAIVYGYE